MAALGRYTGAVMPELLEPKPDNHCFGCGAANHRGLKLTFELDRERGEVRGRVRLAADLQGSSGMAHGGIIALLLDETMGKLNRLYDGARAVTADLRIEYLRPVPTETELTLVAKIESREGRNLLHRGELLDGAGAVLARARARFVVVR